ncbi:MAG: hypothetical protein Ta2E_13040 [Mycoplasmoidaceae bacterium]|nr:MAG: hypothetical protein Ta2E_13040 [Mycoplasmoidaceae bacterium]
MIDFFEQQSDAIKRTLNEENQNNRDLWKSKLILSHMQNDIDYLKV